MKVKLGKDFELEYTKKGFTLWRNKPERHWVLDASTFIRERTVRLGGTLVDNQTFHEFIVKDEEAD